MKFNYLFFIFWVFTFQNCFLHSVSIESKYGMDKYSQIKIQTEKLKPIPVKVNFGKTKDQDLKGFYHGTLFSAEASIIVSNYFTEEYFSKFRKRNSFHLNSDSNLKIEINAYPEKKFTLGYWWFVFATYTLFIVPSKDYTNTKVHFDIYDIKNNSKLKSYIYDIEHRIYRSWLSIPLAGVILPIFSERFDQSKNLKTYAIARVAFNEFEEDFIKDFHSDEKLQKAAYLNNPPIYKIQNPTKEEIANNPYLPYLVARLESKLIQRGIEIIKQDDSPNNNSSLKANQVIKVDSLNIPKDTLIYLKDSINVNVSCLDVKNNTEIWVEKVSLSADADNTEYILDKAVDKLIENLVSKGEIN